MRETLAEPPISLLIVGAQKAGTTSLFRYLAAHPDVHAHDQKEFTFFLHPAEYDHDIALALHRYFGTASCGNRVAKHAMLMYSEEAIRLAAQHVSNAEIVVILRDPVRRAYSAYWYARRRGWENARTFEEALALEPQRLATDGWYHWRNCAYVYNGLYDVHLARLFQSFSPGRITVATSEQLAADPNGVVNGIIARLALPPMPFSAEQLNRRNVAAVARSETVARFLEKLRHSRATRALRRRVLPSGTGARLRSALMQLNERPGVLPPIRSDTEFRLREEFAPSVRELEKLTGMTFKFPPLVTP
jgi:hypothetical protein